MRTDDRPWDLVALPESSSRRGRIGELAGWEKLESTLKFRSRGRQPTPTPKPLVILLGDSGWVTIYFFLPPLSAQGPEPRVLDTTWMGRVHSFKECGGKGMNTNGKVAFGDGELD